MILTIEKAANGYILRWSRNKVVGRGETVFILKDEKNLIQQLEKIIYPPKPSE